MGLSFLLSRLKIDLEEIVHIRMPRPLQEAVHLSRLQLDILKDLEKKMLRGRVISSNTQTTCVSTGLAPCNSYHTSSITSLNFVLANMDTKGNNSSSISRKDVSDRIAKGLCRF